MEGARVERVAGDTARRRAIVLIAVANVLGGVSYPMQKAALAGLPAPATVTQLRTLVAIALLAAFARWRGTPFAAWTRRDVARTALLGVLAMAAPLLLGIEGVRLSTASNGSILILLEPVTIVLLARFVLRERIASRKLLGAALGLAGALAIVFEGASLSDLMAGPHLAGNVLLAVHGVLWGLYTPLAKPLSERHDAVALTLLSFLFAMIVFVPAAALEWNGWSASAPGFGTAVGWSVALGVLVSFLSTVLWLASLRYISAASVAVFVFLQPLAGVATGVFVQGESMSLAALAGSALIVLGLALAILGRE
jgi:drug/metabolite transporter (DMT)-like permease